MVNPNSPREQIKFITVVPDAGAINAGVTYHLNLEAIKSEYGHNFNTLIIQNNTSDEELIIVLDGRNAMYVQVGDSWSFDWETAIQFDDIKLTNNSVTNTSANEIRVLVGRTGP